MFKPEIKKVIDRYINNYWYIKNYPVDKQKEELLTVIKEGIVPAYTLFHRAIDDPDKYKEFHSYLKDYPLLQKCVEFIKQENITFGGFTTMLTIKNENKFNQELTKMVDAILTKEIEPYFKLIFEDMPTRKARANDLFPEEITND